MPIKLAFSTVACPEWSLERVVEQARAMGYAGVELRTLPPGASAGQPALACDPGRLPAKRVAEMFQSAGLELVCLSTSVSLDAADARLGRQAVMQAETHLESARAMGCRAVRVFAHQAKSSATVNAAVVRLAEMLAPLARRAEQLGVRLLVENSGPLAAGRACWALMNAVEHPAVGLCWNVANAAAAGESATVSVPLLHSRIHLAKVKDANVGQGAGLVPLGQGTVGVEQFIHRLLGVGYSGYLSVEWDRLWLPELAPAQEYLPQAHATLRGWLEGIAKAIEDARLAGLPKPKPVPGAAHAGKPAGAAAVKPGPGASVPAKPAAGTSAAAKPATSARPAPAAKPAPVAKPAPDSPASAAPAGA